MRILHVITSLQTGGAEKLMVDLLPRFAEKGVEVELAVFNAVETPFMLALQNKGIVIHRFYPKGCNVYNIGNLFKLFSLIRKGKFDIVHTHNTAPQLFAAVASLFIKSKFVTTEHNTSNNRRNKRWLYFIDKWMYSRYTEVMCISDEAKESLNSYLAQKRCEKVIFNGVDYESFFNPIKDISQNYDFKIVMVASFRSQKDQGTLIRAMKRLPENYRLRLVGDGPCRYALENLALTSGVTHKVEFAGIQSDVAGELRRADIIVMSSHYEGLSLSSLEGMASGRPFVASDVPGLHEVVAGAGILFPEGDDQALANCIIDLTNNYRLYYQTAKRCQERVKGFDIGTTTNEYLYVYKNFQSIN